MQTLASNYISKLESNYSQTAVAECVAIWKTNRDPKALRNLMFMMEAVVGRFTKQYHERSDFKDLQQVARLAIYEALERFDLKRGLQFATFVTPFVRGRVLNYFRDDGLIYVGPRAKERGDAVPELVPLNAPTPGKGIGEPGPAYEVPFYEDHIARIDREMYAEKINKAVSKAIKKLPPEQLAVLKHYVLEGKSLKDFANERGYSRQKAGWLSDKALKFLREELAHLKEDVTEYFLE